MIRSFLKTMKLPPFLWGEALRHSIYILNSLPTRALSDQTPYEAWTGVKPNLEYVKVFGCVCYMKIPAVQMTKLDDRSRMVINLGKEPGSKAYRLYDLVSKRVYVARDVVFSETKAWDRENFQEQNTRQNGHITVFGFDQTKQI